MPRDTIQIPLDEVGIICNVDARDTGENSMVIKQSDKREIFRKIEHYAAYTKNLDPACPKGRIQPLKAHSQVTSNPNLTDTDIAGKIIQKSYWIEKADGKSTLVYYNGTDVRVIEDFYGSPSTVSGSAASTLKCAANNNEELHIGTGSIGTTTPKWLGYTANNLFGGIGQMVQTTDINPATGSTNVFLLGDYTGTADADLYIKITASNHFQWKIGSGGTYSADITLAKATVVTDEEYYYNVNRIGNGLAVIFTNTPTDYDVDDVFKFPLTAKVNTLYSSEAAVTNIHGISNGNIEMYIYPTEFTGAIPAPFTAYDGNWQKEILYAFKFSVEYDGYQESELTTETYKVDLRFSTGGVHYADSNKVNIVMNLFGAGTPSYFNKRITAINLYMAETSEPSTDAFNKSLDSLSAYRLVQRIPLSQQITEDKIRFNGTIRRNLTGGANDKQIDFVFTAPPVTSLTYEENTGRSETLKDPSINYELSCQSNNYHFVAKCYHSELKEFANQMLFRSDLACYDTFNWSTNFVNLPFVPLQIAAYNGKIIVFGTNKIIKVDAITLSIEETINGIGIVPDLEPLVNDKGVYWFDKSGIYIYDGKEVIDISTTIFNTYNSSLKSFSNTLALGTNFPRILYSAEKKGIMFTYVAYTGGNKTLSAWFYHLEKLEWYYWDLATADYLSYFYPFSGKDNEIFVCVHNTEAAINDGTTYKLFASSTYLAAELITKKYDAGLQNQYKKFYKINASGSTNLPTITYDVNDGTALNKTLTSSKLNSSDWKSKNIQIKVSINSSSSLYYLDTLEIVFRQLVGMR